MLSEPMIREGPGIYRFQWTQEHISVLVRGIHGENSKTGCELIFETDLTGETMHLHWCAFNLTSTRSRSELAKHMAGLVRARNLQIDWTMLLERMVVEVLDRSRKGCPVVVLDSSTRPSEPNYVLWPIMPEKDLSILFGLGGAGKSYMALLMAIILQTGWADNPLGLRALQQPMPVLYLDWETNRDEVDWRLWKLTRGLGIKPVQIKYRHCFRPLADDLEAIQETVMNDAIGAVIVDSIGWAAGGDLNNTEPAIRLVQAIRQLDTTALAIAHTAKNAEADKRTAYGNVYYTNGARAAWEIDKVQEVGEGEIEIGLFCRKANSSQLFDPRGFRLAFDDKTESVKVRAIDLAKTAGFEARMPVSRRILAVLKAQGRMGRAELAEELNVPSDTVRLTLRRMVQRGQVVELANGVYGASA